MENRRSVCMESKDISSTSPDVTNPKVGGLQKSEDVIIITFVGTDPDVQVNVFTYNAIDDKYTINTYLLYNINHIQVNKDPFTMDKI